MASTLSPIEIDCSTPPGDTVNGDPFEATGRRYVVYQIPPGIDLRIAPDDGTELARVAPGDVIELDASSPNVRALWSAIEGAPTGAKVQDDQRYARLFRCDGLQFKPVVRRVGVFGQAVRGGTIDRLTLTGAAQQLPAGNCDELVLSAWGSNVGDVSVKFSNAVSASVGWIMSPGDKLTLRIDDMARVFVFGTLNDKISYYAPSKVGR